MEMASRGNRHCASCIGTLSFTVVTAKWLACWTQAQNGLGSNRSTGTLRSVITYVLLFSDQNVFRLNGGVVVAAAGSCASLLGRLAYVNINHVVNADHPSNVNPLLPPLNLNPLSPGR